MPHHCLEDGVAVEKQVACIGQISDIYPNGGRHKLPYRTIAAAPPCPACDGDGYILNPLHDEDLCHAIDAFEARHSAEMRSSGKTFDQMPKEWQRQRKLIVAMYEMVSPVHQCDVCGGKGSRVVYEDELFNRYLQKYLHTNYLDLEFSNMGDDDVFVVQYVETDV